MRTGAGHPRAWSDRYLSGVSAAARVVERGAARHVSGTAPSRRGGGVTGRVVVVTGTDTDVGKTVVTAALAVALRAQDPEASLAVYKPTQTGVAPATSATSTR